MTRLLVTLAALHLPPPAPRHDCETLLCRERVVVREATERWRQVVDAYGRGLLRARMWCESGSSGGYRLSTTGNGYWFAHQFNVGAWTGAGGRVRFGRPVGVWTMQPTRLEQDYRAARWDRINGGDSWPNCP
jgi:hypothetical protein